MHGFVEGIGTGNRPVVKLDYIRSDEEMLHGRHLVVIGVEFLNEKVRLVAEPMLKESSRHTDNPLIKECDVLVRDKDEFVTCLRYKSQHTLMIWIALGVR
jgi:hypothetical protein